MKIKFNNQDKYKYCHKKKKKEMLKANLIYLILIQK